MDLDDIDYYLLRVVSLCSKLEVHVLCAVTRERCVTILRCIPAPRLVAPSRVVPARLDRSDLTTARSI
jgi:hypothetical protein